MESQAEDNKRVYMSDIKNEQEQNIRYVYEHCESVLSNPVETFQNKARSLIELWKQLRCSGTSAKIQAVISLMDWAKLHTLNIVLSGEWKKHKDSFESKLLNEVEICEKELKKLNHSFSLHCRKLIKVINDPWGNATLNKLLNAQDPVIGPEEFNFFMGESGYLISMRLKKLCESHCEDLALNLVTAYMRCCDYAETQQVNMNLTDDQKRFMLDAYIALLYKYKKTPVILSMLKSLSLKDGLELVKRYAKKRVNLSKLWRHSIRITHLAAVVFCSTAVIQPIDEIKEVLVSLLDAWLTLSEKDENLDSLISSVRKVIQVTISAPHMYLFCEALNNKFGEKIKTFNIELYIQALTTDLNLLERQKNEENKDKLQETSKRLADGLLQLADLFDDHLIVCRECVLTSFSLQPTKECLARIEDIGRKCGYEVLDTGQWECKLHPPLSSKDELGVPCRDCGEFMSPLQLEAALNTNTTLNEALTAERLGLSPELCDDLVIVVCSPRYQLLSWLQKWPDLHRLCVMYLNDLERTKNLVTELKFLDIDYSLFMNIKREPEDEHTGYEIGYEKSLDSEIYSDPNIGEPPKPKKKRGRKKKIRELIGETLQLPAPKSDPEVLKTLRSFRRTFKRKSDTDSFSPGKVFIGEASHSTYSNYSRNDVNCYGANNCGDYNSSSSINNYNTPYSSNRTFSELAFRAHEEMIYRQGLYPRDMYYGTPHPYPDPNPYKQNTQKQNPYKYSQIPSTSGGKTFKRYYSERRKIHDNLSSNNHDAPSDLTVDKELLVPECTIDDIVPEENIQIDEQNFLLNEFANEITIQDTEVEDEPLNFSLGDTNNSQVVSNLKALLQNLLAVNNTSVTTKPADDKTKDLLKDCAPADDVSKIPEDTITVLPTTPTKNKLASKVTPIKINSSELHTLHLCEAFAKNSLINNTPTKNKCRMTTNALEDIALVRDYSMKTLTKLNTPTKVNEQVKSHDEQNTTPEKKRITRSNSIKAKSGNPTIEEVSRKLILKAKESLMETMTHGETSSARDEIAVDEPVCNTKSATFHESSQVQEALPVIETEWIDETNNLVEKVLTNTLIKETSLDQEVPLVKDVQLSDEVPSIEEVPTIEDLPSIEMPLVQELPLAEELNSVQEVPVVEEVPSAKEVPSIGDVPSVEKVSSVDQVSLVEKMEVPSIRDLPLVNEATSVKEVPLMKEPVNEPFLNNETYSGTSGDSQKKDNSDSKVCNEVKILVGPEKSLFREKSIETIFAEENGKVAKKLPKDNLSNKKNEGICNKENSRFLTIKKNLKNEKMSETSNYERKLPKSDVINEILEKPKDKLNFQEVFQESLKRYSKDKSLDNKSNKKYKTNNMKDKSNTRDKSFKTIKDHNFQSVQNDRSNKLFDTRPVSPLSDIKHNNSSQEENKNNLNYMEKFNLKDLRIILHRLNVQFPVKNSDVDKNLNDFKKSSNNVQSPVKNIMNINDADNVTNKKVQSTSSIKDNKQFSMPIKNLKVIINDNDIIEPKLITEYLNKCELDKSKSLDKIKQVDNLESATSNDVVMLQDFNEHEKSDKLKDADNLKDADQLEDVNNLKSDNKLIDTCIFKDNKLKESDKLKNIDTLNKKVKSSEKFHCTNKLKDTDNLQKNNAKLKNIDKLNDTATSNDANKLKDLDNPNNSSRLNDETREAMTSKELNTVTVSDRNNETKTTDKQKNIEAETTEINRSIKTNILKDPDKKHEDACLLINNDANDVLKKVDQPSKNTVNGKIELKDAGVLNENNELTFFPRVLLQRLELDNSSYVKSVLANVPGLNDTELIRPSLVNSVVNVVQIAGGRPNTTVTSNPQASTQVSPHIQRIGQPRTDKPETSTETTSSTTNTKTSTANSKPVSSQPSTLINILSQQIIKPGQSNSVRSRSGPLINILSQQIVRPANSTASTVKTTTTASTTEAQSNSTPKIVTGEQQIINQIMSPVRTTVPSLKLGSSSESSRIVQFICQSSDGKLIPVTSFTPNRVVKVATTQTVTSSSPGSPTYDENYAKLAHTTPKSKSESTENSETLPKFQQAFGKSVYQNNVDSTNSTNITNNVVNNTEVDKGKVQPKSTSLNIKPIQGGVIYTRQMPVGQTINLIPQTRAQVFRIATSNSEQISLVKDTVIHNKMSALLAAALQGKKNSEGTDSDTNTETTSAQLTTRVALTRPTLVQNTRIVKPVLQIPSNVIRNTPQANLSSTTLEQLREFDMVYKQVKERSSTVPTNEAVVIPENSETAQRISVTYVNQGQKINCAPVVVVSSYSSLQPAASPALSVASQSSSSPCVTPAPTPTQVLPKVTPKSSKGKSVKSTTMHTSKASPIPKPQQKPQEDEHTTQRIFDILAEYAEQLRNSPDLNNKPAPRRRSNPPTNPSQNSKRKKSSSSKKTGQCSSSLSTEADVDDPRTMGSEDSSCGVMQLSMQDDEQPSTVASTSESNDSSVAPRQQLILTDSSHNQTHNLIIADSSVGEALKMPNTAVLVPGNYIMPVSMVKGGQQIAVVSGGSKILATVPARSGPNMLLFQSFLNQTRKTTVPTVKYSTIQPITGISSQSLAGVSAQPPVILPPSSHGISTVTLGQSIAVKKLDDSDRVNTELLLTISQSRENDSTSEDTPQPDSSTNIVTANIETVEIEETATLSDNSSEKTYSYRKPLIATPIATPVIAQATCTKDELTDDQSQGTPTIMTLSLNADRNKADPGKVEERVQSVLVTAGTSNGPMLAHSPPHYKQSDCSSTISSQNKDDFLRSTGKKNQTDTKTYPSNNVYSLQGKIKKVQTGTQRLDRELQQLCLQRKQAALERELRLQKSLSEECEDLGVDEPSTSDLFPEADLLFDSNHSPSFDQSSQDLIKRPTHLHDGKDESKLTLFSDDDFLFEPGEYQTTETELEYDEDRSRLLTNGQSGTSTESESPCEDNTLLQTCTSMSDVTLNSPISPETYNPTTPSPLTKYVHKYSNRKKNERLKQIENWTAEVSSSEDTTGSTELVKSSSRSPELCLSKRSDEELSDSSFKVVHVAISKTECGDLHCTEDTDCSLSGRGARRSVKKLCSCCNGSQDGAASRKRPASQPHTPTPHKKAFPSKKR